MDGGASPADGQVALSIVLITENEADRVEDCIESVVAAARRAVPSFEVILVDSASTDRTVDLASDYPITILRIPDEHTVSCGAGRYVGDHEATGERVLHVDGDMKLTETWLASAVSYLEDNEDVAAVEGCLNTVDHEGVQEVETVGGVMLFDADVLEAVGGFDPYLLGYEDIELAYRLSSAGYRLVSLPEVSASHEWEGGFAEPVHRWRAGYFFAPGQAIRRSIDAPDRLVKIVRLQRYKLGLLGWLLAGGVSVLSPFLLPGWLALSAVGFGLIARRRGVRRAVHFGVIKALGVVGLAVGLANPPEPPKSYPLEAIDVVQRGTVFEGRVDPIEQ